MDDYESLIPQKKSGGSDPYADLIPTKKITETEGGAAFTSPSMLPKREKGYASGVISGLTDEQGPSVMQLTSSARQFEKGKQVGEPLGIAADVAMTAFPAYKAGQSLYRGGQALAQNLKLGKTAKELAEDLRLSGERKAGQIAKTTGEEMTAAEQRAAIAGKAEQKAQIGGEYALKPLPGVGVEQEAGRFKPVAQTFQDIGNKVKESANKVMETLKSRRATNAEINKQAAFGDAFQKESKGIQPIHKIDAQGNPIYEKDKSGKVKLIYKKDAQGNVIPNSGKPIPVESDSYKAAEREIKAILKNPVTGLTDVPGSETEQVLKKFLSDINPRQVDPATGMVMGKPASFEGLETVRRRLSDRAFGFPETGFDAINQQQARRLSELVGNIQKEFSPGFDKFLKQYAKDSEPLRVFQSKVGKALTDVQLPGGGANFASVSAQDIPSRVFKSRENFDALISAFGNDRKLAEAEAKRYFASQLEGKTSAKEVETFIRQNRSMLKETNSLPMAEKYAIDLRKYEQRAGAAGKAAKSEQTIAQEKKQLVEDYQTFESDLAVAANDPAKITAASNNLAKKMLAHGQIDQAQYRDLQRQIEQVRLTVRDANEMKDKIKLFTYRALGYGAAATVGSSLATKAFGQ
jgi:ribosomal protein S15P/S13E